MYDKNHICKEKFCREMTNIFMLGLREKKIRKYIFVPKYQIKIKIIMFRRKLFGKSMYGRIKLYLVKRYNFTSLLKWPS